MKPKYGIFILVLMVMGISCKKEKQSVKQTEIVFKKEGELSIYNPENNAVKAKLDIEIADTHFDIQTGLMYRNSLGLKEGMLFVFEDETERFFYMKNTRIPLDLIYINAKQLIVSFQENAKPFDESSLPSNAPAKYVLEINAGLVEDWGVKVGDSVSFQSLVN